MTFNKTALLIMVFFFFVSGCSGENIREGIYQGMYEGGRIKNSSEFTPAERTNRPDPEYDRYSRERQERIERDTRQ